MTVENAEPQCRTDRSGPEPLDTLTTSGEMSGEETLSVVLEQARICLDGLGSLVHVYDPDGGRLRLLAVDGITMASAGPWAELVRAVRPRCPSPVPIAWSVCCPC